MILDFRIEIPSLRYNVSPGLCRNYLMYFEFQRDTPLQPRPFPMDIEMLQGLRISEDGIEDVSHIQYVVLHNISS